MDTTELEKDWLMLREIYFDGVEFRFEDYKQYGYTKDRDFTEWEEEMHELLMITRNRLIEAEPSKYHFGKINKSIHQYNHNIKRHSAQGDQGNVICRKCHQLFKATWKEDRHGIESFESCEGHKGLKSIGELQIKKEELAWL
jgi:hypothetical protein